MVLQRMNVFVFIFYALKNYFNHGSLHGLRFISERGRHWTERFIWLALCVLSWFGSTELIMASWDAFQNSAVSFVVETTYLHVNTSFPSVSVCEDENNMARVYEVSQELFGDDHDCNLDEVLKEVTYFRGTAYYIKEFCFSGDIECPKTNFSVLSDKVRSPCELIFTSCSWRGVKFDCCDHFLPLPTEIGTCYSFNMVNEKIREERGLPYLSLISNRQTSLGALSIGMNISCKVYLHSEADVPFYNTMNTDILSAAINSAKSYGISIIDIENGPEVRDLTVHQRKCRFPDENYLQSSDRYSYSACVVDCRRQEQLRICNCTSHLMPKSRPEERCDINGILCLNNHYSSLGVQKTKWGKKDGLVCDCLPGCNDPEYSVIKVSSIDVPENVSIMEIYLDRLPSERYKRNVVRSRLDLVVSMGGATGLFVGASLLSFVEIAYFLIFRSTDSTKTDEEPIKEEKVENIQPEKHTSLGSKHIVGSVKKDNYSVQAVNIYNYNIKKYERKAPPFPKNISYYQGYLP